MGKKNKSIRYRIYPNDTQKELFEKTFGCVRFVYNQLLEKQEAMLKASEKRWSKFDMNNYINQVLKIDYPWLKEVDKTALTYSAFALDKAYRLFFDHICNRPAFKSKRRSRKSYSTCVTNNSIEVGDDWIKLPKVKKVKAKIHREPSPNWKLKGATIVQECDDKYYCSVLYEYETAESVSALTPTVLNSLNALGLDYCVNGLYVDSNGDFCGNHKYFQKSHDKLAKAKHRLSRKKGGVKGSDKSANYIKQLNKVRKMHRKIAHQLVDHLHKTSTAIANQYDVVCIEDLDLTELKKKHMGMGSFKGKKPLSNGYGLFTRYLTYKLEDRGKHLIKIDKWYPSSKICCSCGHEKIMPIQLRKYCCPVCHTSIDRDINAAINIRNEGLRIFNQSS